MEKEKKELTLEQLRAMYAQDPDKVYVVDLQEMLVEKEEMNEEDTGSR